MNIASIESRKLLADDANRLIHGAKRILTLNKLSKLGQDLVTHVIGENYDEPWEVIEATDEYMIFYIRMPAKNGKTYGCYKIEFFIEG